MREHFSIYTEDVEGKSYAKRFVGSPYNTFVQECRSIVVYTHNKCPERLSPHSVLAVLSKFGIAKDDYKNAYLLYFSQRKLTDDGTGKIVRSFPVN
jgi:hypothetical protein